MCPWDDWDPAVLHFCERELCAWVEQPANTWSNAVYLLVGVLIIVLARREGRASLGWLGVIAIVIGLGSAFFHASSTYAGEVTDVAMMYLFSAFAVTFNARRAFGIAHPARLYSAVAGGSIVLMALWMDVAIFLFAAHIVVAGVLEIRIRRKRIQEVRYRALFLLCLFFLIAWGFWWLDVLKIVCDPDEHVFQGHAAWHVLNSFSVYFAYRFYAQFVPPAAPA